MRTDILRHGVAALICMLLAGAEAPVTLAQSTSGQPPAASAQPSATVEAVSIDGYRSARFGMSEAEVKKAIKTDLGGDAPARVVNETERTTVLLASNRVLLPDSPPATLSYILGASSAKLIQVNIVWGDNGGVDAKQIVPTANALAAYFLEEGSYAKDSVVVNQGLPDGTALVFRGADAKSRMVVLQLVPIAPPADEKKPGKDKQVEFKKAMLRLSYIANPTKPDVFRIEKGKF